MHTVSITEPGGESSDPAILPSIEVERAVFGPFEEAIAGWDQRAKEWISPVQIEPLILLDEAKRDGKIGEEVIAGKASESRGVHARDLHLRRLGCLPPKHDAVEVARRAVEKANIGAFEFHN